ncbi:MAG: cysteine desulfurase family protein [Armatimonadota bacterium]|nr:cysteine desulfurase family protein [Armatimonadota bacterium]
MRKTIYLDHSATTPVEPAVFAAMTPYLTEKFGNASSIHSFGRDARAAVDEARDTIASSVGASAAEIHFTSGGTEADNLAVLGAARANRDRGDHIVTCATEHHAVLESCKRLEEEGFRVTYLPVDSEGLFDPSDVASAITDRTILVSIMHVNNEIGVIHPISIIGRSASERGVLFHTDAVQSFGVLRVDVDRLNVDLLSASAHKIYGPKGAGFLYVRSGVRIEPLQFGGGQERERRPGTENVAGIVGLGAAAELALSQIETTPPRLAALRDYLIDSILSRFPDAHVNGHRQLRAPGNANISFAGVEGEILLLNLDLEGIAASSGSACTAGSTHASHVLTALQLSPELARGSLRLTVGRGTTKEDIDEALVALETIVGRLRE